MGPTPLRRQLIAAVAGATKKSNRAVLSHLVSSVVWVGRWRREHRGLGSRRHDAQPLDLAGTSVRVVMRHSRSGLGERHVKPRGDLGELIHVPGDIALEPGGETKGWESPRTAASSPWVRWPRAMHARISPDTTWVGL